MAETRGLIGYLKEKCGLPDEGAMVWGEQYRKLTEEDKQTLVKWAHEQGDTHVVVRVGS